MGVRVWEYLLLRTPFLCVFFLFVRVGVRIVGVGCAGGRCSTCISGGTGGDPVVSGVVGTFVVNKLVYVVNRTFSSLCGGNLKLDRSLSGSTISIAVVF